jgi:hypothetical protein
MEAHMVRRSILFIMMLFLLSGASTPTLAEETSILPDPLIQQMIDQVTPEQVLYYDRQLVGEIPVWVDDGWYTISTRYTYSGEPIHKTTNFIGQHLAGLGMQVEYHQWGGADYPNVIGELPGVVNPEQIYIIGGHLDAASGTPGADDNASGSVATLLAADILSQYRWGCTLRFAFWTGEEQWMLGSYAYAERTAQNNEDLRGYLNLDMLGWNTPGSQPGIDLIYSENIPPSLALAELFASVVDGYALELVAEIINDPSGGSDHLAFWDFGFNAILAIEDEADFNPYYHEAGDTPGHLDLTYFTDYVKASLGTFAHLTGCLIEQGIGQIDGHITSGGGAPIAGATITAEDSYGQQYQTTTDPAGYYTRTLVTDIYTVTASAYAYQPVTVSGVDILSNTLTSLDITLPTSPIYQVSGVISEQGSGLPLVAQITFEGSPVTAWSDPSTGHYQAELPEGDYMMRVQADMHRPEERPIHLDQPQQQDFSLPMLACLLLVDDDQDNPDYRSAYTQALDSLDASYDTWDVATAGDPTLVDLTGYRHLIWFTGAPQFGTFNGSNEAEVSAYLDSGGNLLLSSQSYLAEMNLTAFGQDYLHIGNFVNNAGQIDLVGANIFSGLGPFTLDAPFQAAADMVNPDGLGQVAFAGNTTNAAVSYTGSGLNTLFMGFALEGLPQADRSAVFERALASFGGCAVQAGWWNYIPLVGK